ncbi:NUDIX hydrolase [Celeribacter neptunius]|uniref:8-oxo-dGTP pyrophosphatase MutT, NUDIX family n=1 Tax=Celeribacter neptunius TaxID=588602 RepID=A0A1I3W7M6_9RHOB|nr:NUDIX hydrolase [Celeribacter neptunius]SFK03279.1 8-oxo-dGTP pyrophosphatase MutT, NUDIX family [Celeribacter neptunius]
MVTLLKSAWEGVFDPLLRRPSRVQSAALCWRKGKKGKEILLITSRDTGRWIIPKGWPIAGLDGAGTAAQEAWEEAGVKPARIKRKPLGLYHYIKKLDNGVLAPVEASVYPIEVERLEKTFPEKDERTRRWLSPAQAAALVEEPELREMLLDF